MLSPRRHPCSPYSIALIRYSVQKPGHIDRLALVNYTFHDTHSAQFSQLALFCYDNRFACTSFRKTVFQFEILNGNTSRFAPYRIRLKMCVEMKEEARAHDLGNILAP